MRPFTEVEKIIRQCFSELGRNPHDLIQIKLKDGSTSETALSFEITDKDHRKATVFRKSLDDDDKQAIRDALSNFK
jgi:hypothetical protein